MNSALKLQNSLCDESTTWDDIRNELSVLKIDLKPMQGHGSQRLGYEDFERIFYELFSLIDGPGTRRKFRLIYPASGRDRRDQFIDSSITFINQRRLTQQPISKSHLRAFGGETFRKLLSTLIRQVNQKHELLEALFPLVPFERKDDFKSLNSLLGSEKPRLRDIADILRRYPDERYNDRCLLEASTEYFE